MDAVAVEALATKGRQQRGVDVEHRALVRSHQRHGYQLRRQKHVLRL